MRVIITDNGTRKLANCLNNDLKLAEISILLYCRREPKHVHDVITNVWKDRATPIDIKRVAAMIATLEQNGYVRILH